MANIEDVIRATMDERKKQKFLTDILKYKELSKKMGEGIQIKPDYGMGTIGTWGGDSPFGTPYPPSVQTIVIEHRPESTTEIILGEGQIPPTPGGNEEEDSDEDKRELTDKAKKLKESLDKKSSKSKAKVKADKKDSSESEEKEKQDSESEFESESDQDLPEMFKKWMQEQQAKSDNLYGDESINEDRVKEIISEALVKLPPKTIEIKTGEDTQTIQGLIHFQFELVLKALQAGVNLALSGSTATSKTTMAVQAAKALNRSYFVQPVNEGTTKADILGYCTATGTYVPSLLYTAMKQGYILVVEEIDSGSPASLLAFNNAIDNRELSFPNSETVQAHEHFGIVCTMNTKGTGSDRKFVGRNRLDAATLDRFVILEIEQDFSLEAAIIGVTEKQKKIKVDQGGIPTAQEWLDNVRSKRESYKRSHPDKIVSMRATRDGWKLANVGFGLHWLLKMCVDK